MNALRNNAWFYLFAMMSLALYACRDSKDSQKTVMPDPAETTEVQADCIRQKLAGTNESRIHPYDAVLAFKNCGGTDHAAFAKAANQVFKLDDGTAWTLKD